MAIEANFLTVRLFGSIQNVVGSGLAVAQVVDADSLAYTDLSIDGSHLGWDYSALTDRVELIAANGDSVELSRVGDRWRWAGTPDDLRGPTYAPGESFSETCQIVVTRTASLDTVTNPPGRWTSKPFTVTVTRQVGFTPDLISGLVLHLSAYDIEEAVGAAVTTWDDRSVYDRDVTEATNKPTRQNDGTGRPYLDFDGSNDLLSSVWDKFGLACTVFVAGQIDSYDGTVRGFCQIGGTNGARLAFDNANLKGISGTDTANTTLPELDTPFVATVTKTASGAITVKKGLGSAVSQASTAAVTPGIVTIGDTTADAAADVRIYEIIVFDSVLSAENQAKCIRHLQKKWSANG